MLKRLIISIAIPLLVGFGSSYFVMDSLKAWYPALQKPWFNPPNWVFGPVWTLLYILMGAGLYLVWQSPRPGKGTTVWLFSAQLILNFFWSVIFFYQHVIWLALADILLLWVLIITMIFSFNKFSHIAAWLQVPYALWVSFATILNFYIWRLN